MTSRPGQLERPSNVRTLSRPLATPGALQRPSPHRAVSLQHPTPSSSRRNTNESTIDLTLDTTEVVGNRAIPRSRLNLEIGHDGPGGDAVESPRHGETSLSAAGGSSQLPRNRPKLHADFDVSIRSAQEAGTIKPMPLPPRPRQYAQPTSTSKSAQTQTNVKKDARPKPFTLEVPTIAPSFPANGVADFNPWTGNHPEDQFSENVIRQGYYDKTQMTQNETGSAKAAIFPALKHKSGLQTLSSLFTSVMAQRRFNGQINAASTFKPPPRVTVTDTKREIWLKDLANSTIPLRRLSRSIPHGIRGKVLLDQSLSKEIPIERAVWLAKCVGANELRSFRRKGVSGTLALGGEVKWIRDFTVCVEQFVEGIVAACGEADFRKRINYAIRLATHFHTENLLDGEHYLDWLVASLETAPVARLPIWLLITQIYWKDLLQQRKHGRRLCCALIKHLREVTNPEDHDILGPLYDRLKELLKDLVLKSPDSLIRSRNWLEDEEVLQTVFEAEDDQLKDILRQLTRRNAKFAAGGTATGLSSRRQLLNSLDAALIVPITADIPLLLWTLDVDKGTLVTTVLAWATTVRRPGPEKTFIAVRVLRAWSKHGLDITSLVLDFVGSGNAGTMSSRPGFYHLTSELVRSGHFSVARYLEWLIARGGVHQNEAVTRDGPVATRLIAELPVHSLTQKEYDLRSTLLSRAVNIIDEEEDDTQKCMAIIDSLLVNMPSADNDPTEKLDVSLETIETHLLYASWTTKSEIGLWLRHKIKTFLRSEIVPSMDEWSSISTKGQISQLTLDDFTTIRRCLLLTADFSMLADVLKLVSDAASSDILASCADTLNLYILAFSAVGAIETIFETLMARVNGFTERLESIPRILLVAFSDLASRLPQQQKIAAYLKQELIRSDRKTAADACSPVSDHMALMQTAEADFSDEIERILASGNSMDKGTLERLFQRIIMRLEESLDKTPEQQRSCSLLLTRLKTFDVESFNVLLTTWVARFVQLRQRPSLVQILGPLVSFGCIALSDVVKIIISGSGGPNVRVLEEALSLILPVRNIPEAMSSGEVCRFSIKQSQLQKEFPRDVLFIVRRAIETIVANPNGESRLYGEDMDDLIKRLVLADTDMVIQELITPLLQKSEPGVFTMVTSTVDKLLLGSQAKTPITAEIILDLADDLSLPFCQLKLAAMFSSGDTTMVGSTDGSASQLEAFNTAIEMAVSNGKTSWSSIVPLFDSSIAKHLRQRATTQFLAALPSLRTLVADDTIDLQQSFAHAKDLLHIVNVTAFGVANSPGGGIVATSGAEIPLALHNAWLILASGQIRTPKKDVFTVTWLPLLLQFAKSQRDVFENTKTGNESRGKTVITLATIYMELSSKINMNKVIIDLAQDVYDLALYLVDSLPDDVRLQCIRSLRDTASLAPIKYLFSITTNPSEWLVLMQREKVVVVPTSANANKATSAVLESSKSVEKERPAPYPFRRWEMLQEPTPNIGENDTSLSLTLFGARRG